MASGQTIDKILANMALRFYDLDPNATTATDVAWVDIRDYFGFGCGFMRTIGTSAFTLKILANPNSDGSGTDVTVVSHAVGSEPDAVEDQIWLECTAAQVADLGATLRYVSMNYSFATGTDEGVGIYVRWPARFAADALTADIVA